MRREYDRSKTGDVDRVEVIVLRYPRADRAVLLCPPPQVPEIVRLWRLLPTGVQARCHIPAYGLRFYNGETQVLEATLCWRCNNIHLRAARGPCYSTFDGPSAAAQELRGILQGVAGTGPGAA